MKQKPLPFAKLLRSFRHGAKQLNRQLAEGRFERFSARKQARILHRLRKMYHQLAQQLPLRQLRRVVAGAALLIGLGSGVQGQNFAAPVAGAFGMPAVVDSPAVHTLVDIDGDGDLDIMVSEGYDYYNNYAPFIKFIENTGTNTAPAFAAPVD
ncbi:MAG: hypothetical protein AAF206_11090, partial [Bacteroidota bacterium]